MESWTQNVATQAQVKVLILDDRWNSLPRPPFTEEETEDLAERLYEYVWQRTASGEALVAA
jgi:type I restriction enzyme, R subunit